MTSRKKRRAVVEPCPKDCRCDYCEARAKKRRDDELQSAGKPTLSYQPFAALLAPKEDG